MRTSGWAWEAEGMVEAGPSTVSNGGRCSGYGGEAAPVDNRGREGVGELREDKAKKRGEWNADVLLMLMRARGGDPGLCPRLATTVVKWRSWSSAGAAWRGEGAPSRGKEGGVESGRDAWETTASRRWPGPSTAAGGADCAGGAEAEWERGEI